MAAAGGDLRLNGVADRLINSRLVGVVPGRSMDAVKGQKRRPEHPAAVRDLELEGIDARAAVAGAEVVVFIAAVDGGVVAAVVEA